MLVSIKYALDFSYYHDGRRQAPQNLHLGERIFDEPATADPVTPVPTERGQASVTEGPSFLPGQLSDSDDSDGDDGMVQAPPPLPGQPTRRRERVLANPADEDVSSLKRLRTSYAGYVSMLRSIDHVIALRESPMVSGSGSSLVSYSGSTSTKAQYNPSALQRVIHSQLVNGTYASMEPQLLLETLQIQYDSFAFLPHPAILRACYSWDFGLRGLSLMHFVPLGGGSKGISSHNMTDFSKSALLPTAAVPANLSTVIDALDGLAGLVATVYLPYVGDLVVTARKFVVSLKSREGFTSEAALNELVYWLNGRFERVRGFLALKELESTQQVRENSRSQTLRLSVRCKLSPKCACWHSSPSIRLKWFTSTFPALHPEPHATQKGGPRHKLDHLYHRRCKTRCRR